MAAVGAGLHDTSVVRLTVGMPGGDVTWIGIEESSGRAVWATLITRGGGGRRADLEGLVAAVAGRGHHDDAELGGVR